MGAGEQVHGEVQPAEAGPAAGAAAGGHLAHCAPQVCREVLQQLRDGGRVPVPVPVPRDKNRTRDR